MNNPIPDETKILTTMAPKKKRNVILTSFSVFFLTGTFPKKEYSVFYFHSLI